MHIMVLKIDCRIMKFTIQYHKNMKKCLVILASIFMKTNILAHKSHEHTNPTIQNHKNEEVNAFCLPKSRKTPLSRFFRHGQKSESRRVSVRAYGDGYELDSRSGKRASLSIMLRYSSLHQKVRSNRNSNFLHFLTTTAGMPNSISRKVAMVCRMYSFRQIFSVHSNFPPYSVPS